MLNLTTLTDGIVSGGSIGCGSELALESQEYVGFCGLISLTDSVSGSEAPENNTQTAALYDACGNLVGSGSTGGWHTIGYSYLESNSWLGSDTFYIPISGPCSGTWTVVYTFSETFTDGQTLSVGVAWPYSVTLTTTAPPTAYGQGNGDSSVFNPTACAGDPVNCASGNFSETETDFSVPGRGPALDLSRTYNSLTASTPGIFGYGWTSSYESHLVVNSDGSVTVTEGDGSQVTATPNGSGGYTIPTWSDSTLTQNSDGSWTFVRQQRTTYTFNSSGQLTSITDLNGYTTTLSYTAGQLTTVTDPEGRTLSFSYGSNGFVSQVAGPDSETVAYGYDGNGNLTSVTDPANRTWQFGYDSNHLLTTLTDPNLGQTVNQYNSSAQVVQQTDPAGLVTQFSYSGDNFSSSGGTTTITGPHGEVSYEDYNSGLLVDSTEAAGTSASGTSYYYYDPTTLGLRAVTDPNGNTTSMSYDSYGDLLTKDTAAGQYTSYTYNSLRERTLVTDPAGIQTAYTYDANGNVQTKTVTGSGGSPVETTNYSYTDGHPGDVTEITDPAGHVSDYTYDQYGDVATITTHPKTGLNNTAQFTYDALGRKVCEASPNATAAGVSCPAAGQPRVADTTTWVYNGDGQATSQTDPRGNTTAYSYDNNGNQTKVTDPNTNVTQTTFDADNRPLNVTAGYGTTSAATTSYVYDIAPGTAGCSSSVSGTAYCTTVTDPSGQVTTDYINARGEQIQQTSPESGTATSTYDATGNPLTDTTAGGTATYTYDTVNRVTAIAYTSPGTGFTTAPNVTYAYNADNNRTSMTDGSGTSTYAYDSLQRLDSVTNGAGTIITYGYDLDNEVTSIGYPGPATKKGGTTQLNLTQGYDGAGEETSVTDWLGHTTNFSYDADGNITSEAYPNSTTATSSYDAADNLLKTADALNSTPNSPFVSETYTYNPDSQVATETDTGLPGAATDTYGYDPLSRVTSTGSASYSYDASGDPTQLGTSTPAYNSTHQITSLATPITRVGTSSAGDAGTGSTLTVTLPSGTQANDQILLAVTLPGNGTIRTAPSGYTVVGTYSTGSSATASQLVLYRRTAQAGDTSATITFSKTFPKAATVVVYRGVNPTNPIDVNSSGTTTSGTSVTAPSVTTTVAGDQLVLATGALSSAAGTWTPPTGMTSRVSQAGGTTIADAIADEAEPSTGATGAQTATFSTSGALAAALIALRPANTTYTYNALGARSSVVIGGSTTSIGYNQAGEMTSYGTATYTYNGDGLRVSKKIGTGTTEPFTWGQATDGTDTPFMLVDGSTDYVYGPGGVPLEQVSGSTVLYYVHDQLGSTRALTNSSGATVATYTYGPYGNITGQTGTATNPLLFAGEYTDSESGLVYLQNRYYDPASGQFTSVDPLQELTQQPYIYAGDSPDNFIDPTGLLFGLPDPFTPLAAAIGGLVGGVSGAVSYGVNVVTGQQQASLSGFVGATVGGAVGGAATAACAEATDLLAAAPCGAVGGALGNGINNAITGQPVLQGAVGSAVFGAAGTYLGQRFFGLQGMRPYKLSNLWNPGINASRMYNQSIVAALVGTVPALDGAAPAYGESPGVALCAGGGEG